MPLSEQEQRLLDEMERNLYKHEADIVQTSTGPRKVDYTKVAIGVVMLLVGLVGVVVGVVVTIPLLGVAGFGLAVGGALVALAANKPADPDSQQQTKAPGAKSAPKQGSKQSSLMDRISEEWDKRQGQ